MVGCTDEARCLQQFHSAKVGEGTNSAKFEP